MNLPNVLHRRPPCGPLSIAKIKTGGHQISLRDMGPPAPTPQKFWGLNFFEILIFFPRQYLPYFKRFAGVCVIHCISQTP